VGKEEAEGEKLSSLVNINIPVPKSISPPSFLIARQKH